MNMTDTKPFQETVNYAGFWIRSGAAILDSVLIMLLTSPLLYVIYGDSYLNTDDFIQGAPDFLISYILPFIATILFWIYKSATPGKMVVKVRIVDQKTGQPPTTQQSIIRYLGYFVSTIPLGLGIFWIAWDNNKQGWHDKMAGTVVIHFSKTSDSDLPKFI